MSVLKGHCFFIFFIVFGFGNHWFCSFFFPRLTPRLGPGAQRFVESCRELGGMKPLDYRPGLCFDGDKHLLIVQMFTGLMVRELG